MQRQDLIVNGSTVTVSHDDPSALVDRFWGIVGVRLVDELTGKSPTAGVTVSTTTKHVIPRVTEDGVAGLVGIPRKVFPGLHSDNYSVDISIRANGYLEETLQIPIPFQHDFPTTFDPKWLPDHPLHRKPISLIGRCVLMGATGTSPVAGAVVRISKIWRTKPPVHIALPGDPPNILCLREPIYAPRKAAITQMRGRLLDPATGADKRLLDFVSQGEITIRISDQKNISVGDVLLVDSGDPDWQEQIPIAAISGGGTPDQAAEILLAFPLAFAHRMNALIQKANPQALGPIHHLTVDAIRGDSTIFLDGLSGLTNHRETRLDDGGTEEDHRVEFYSAISNAQGYYRLPPLSRIAQLELEANDGVHAAVHAQMAPDYDQPENRLDFSFR